MSREQHISRRAALAGLAATCGAGLIRRASAEEAEPSFSPTGPNAEFYGASAGYPVPNAAKARWQGNPWQPGDRVGAFTHIDDIYSTRQVNRAAISWAFKRAPAELSESFRTDVTGYLARNPVTGLLIAKDDQILFEHYQYGRTDRDRFVSQSMVKSITGLLTGIAISEGAIKSVDDTAETYVPGFRGSEYGRTPIRDAWILNRDEPAFRAPAGPAAAARFLPSGDAYYLLQGVDRELLVPDAELRGRLWTSRVWPGALLVAGEIAGTWRRAQGNLTITPWLRLAREKREAVEAEAQTLPLPGVEGRIAVRWED